MLSGDVVKDGDPCFGGDVEGFEGEVWDESKLIMTWDVFCYYNLATLLLSKLTLRRCHQFSPEVLCESTKPIRCDLTRGT